MKESVLPALKRWQNLAIKYSMDPANKSGVQIAVDQLYKEGLGVHMLVMDDSDNSTLRLAAEKINELGHPCD